MEAICLELFNQTHDLCWSLWHYEHFILVQWPETCDCCDSSIQTDTSFQFLFSTGVDNACISVQLMNVRNACVLVHVIECKYMLSQLLSYGMCLCLEWSECEITLSTSVISVYFQLSWFFYDELNWLMISNNPFVT